MMGMFQGGMFVSRYTQIKAGLSLVPIMNVHVPNQTITGTDFWNLSSADTTAIGGNEGLQQIQAGINGFVQKIWVRVITNGQAAAGAFQLRINTANAGAAGVITGSTTGYFELEINEAVAEDDLITLSITEGGAPGDLIVKAAGIIIRPTGV